MPILKRHLITVPAHATDGLQLWIVLEGLLVELPRQNAQLPQRIRRHRHIGLLPTRIKTVYQHSDMVRCGMCSGCSGSYAYGAAIVHLCSCRWSADDSSMYHASSVLSATG